ncbi:MAG: PadR family transcriptional regulator [Actinomycetia bacterium]|nr:PadR family transcriptional regulator [Actinomycetes bacterium]
MAILSSLADSDSHGYELFDQIESLAGSLVCVDSGTMYRMLREMEQAGLVASSWQTPEAGPSRRVYAVTPEGLEALDLMARSLAQRAAVMQRLADGAARTVERSRREAKNSFQDEAPSQGTSRAGAREERRERE